MLRLKLVMDLPSNRVNQAVPMTRMYMYHSRDQISNAFPLPRLFFAKFALEIGHCLVLVGLTNLLCWQRVLAAGVLAEHRNAVDLSI